MHQTSASLTSPQKRPLTEKQKNILRSLESHRGFWHENCGWVWDTPSGTRKMLESLIKHGAVAKTVEDGWRETYRLVPGFTTESRVCIAYLSHSPEDTAIGLGNTEEEALTALIAAYPRAKGKAVEVTSCAIGAGLPSLEAAPLLCRTSR